MVAPLLLGLVATVRDRGRDYGVMAVLLALFGNFLLLRVVLTLLVATVLL
jgi:hypothetical protein